MGIRFVRASASVLFSALIFAGVLNAQTAKPSPAKVEPSITIDVGGKKTKFGAAELAKLPRQTITVSDHGKEATFEGVALFEVLKLAGVEFGEKLRGRRMAEYLLVEAADNYRAVYALAELDPGFAEKTVILADKRDGKALPENALNWQVVVQGDKRAARWVRQVTSMKVVAAT